MKMVNLIKLDSVLLHFISLDTQMDLQCIPIAKLKSVIPAKPHASQIVQQERDEVNHVTVTQVSTLMQSHSRSWLKILQALARKIVELESAKTAVSCLVWNVFGAEFSADFTGSLANSINWFKNHGHFKMTYSSFSSLLFGQYCYK